VADRVLVLGSREVVVLAGLEQVQPLALLLEQHTRLLSVGAEPVGHREVIKDQMDQILYSALLRPLEVEVVLPDVTLI